MYKTLAEISSVISSVFFYFKLSHIGIAFVVLCVVCLIIIFLKNRNTKEESVSTYLPSDPYEAISLDHPKVKLVIKSFSWKEHEFIHFIDIVNLTGINLNTLHDIIKHLVDNNLITESKELKEHYELSEKGHNFVSSHKKELNKLKLLLS